jgi:TonB-linked SusC/RagA family outer membrane protein
MEISILGGGLPCTLMKPLALSRQVCRVMRLTGLLLFFACMQVSARGYSQTVSFTGRDVPLQNVLSSFEKQTGLAFFFNYSLLKNARVTVDVRDVTLEEALGIILKGQGLGFYQSGRTIFIVKEEKSTAAPGSTRVNGDKEVNVSGKVTNQQGEILAGASVEMKSGKKATFTNEKGMFELKSVPLGATLIVSYTGYQTKEIEINGTDSQTIVLAIANNQLDQAQVIAYGTTTERLSTGDITTVNAVDIEKQSVNNPMLALEGRVPGLVITQMNGLPGSTVQVQIQGQNSIQEGNDPFYVVDGVPYTSELLPGIGQVLGTAQVPISTSVPSYGSPFSYISPDEIESISVMKDADATAIYGSRAANGAILITTKKGKVGKTKVDINLQSGWGKVAHFIDLLNNPQYLQMRHEALNNDGLTPGPSDYDLNGTYDTTRYTNWQKTLIGRTSQYDNFGATVSGGTTSTQYLIGGAYNKETTVFPGDFGDQKGSVHFSVVNVSANQKFHIQFSGNYLFDNNQLMYSDITSSATTLAPVAPALYNPDGSLNWEPTFSGVSSWINPLSYLLNRYSNKTSNLIGNAVLSYQVLPGLQISGNFGYTSLESNEIATFPLTATQPENRPYTLRGAQYATNETNSWIAEPQVSYKKNLGIGRLEVLAGSTFQQNNANGSVLDGNGYNSDLVLDDIHSAASVTVAASTVSVYKYNAFFGRANYNIADEYILNLTARRDGSSRFGASNQFHDFESAGIGWIFSKEHFIQNTLPVLSFGKLRASYGTTGNDQIGDYQYLSLYSPYQVGVAYQNVVGLAPGGGNGGNALANPYLEWEETRKLQFGLDLAFIKDRISMAANYFENRSSNQLLNYTLPIITGFPEITKNFPATVQNSGWELSLNTSNIKTKNFNWVSKVNLTLPQNKLISFPGLATSAYEGLLFIGKPISIVETYHFLGVDPTTGIYQFASSHGGPTSSPNYSTDRTSFVNTLPKFYGGFQNSLIYKGLQLDLFIQFVKRLGINPLHFGTYPGYFASGDYNQPTAVLNRWREPGDIAPIQEFTTSQGPLIQGAQLAQQSDAVYEDASFIRLKNISLSWQLPSLWSQKAHLESCRFFVQGQNLLTLTKYKGLDPETLSSQTLPPLRICTFGLKLVL